MAKYKISEEDIRALQGRVAEKVRNLELTTFSCWSDLDVLSSHTYVDEIEVSGDEIKIDGNKVSGPLNVYVILNYGQRDDGLSTSEGFPGKFVGYIDDDAEVIIEDVYVDTSSFYK